MNQPSSQWQWHWFQMGESRVYHWQCRQDAHNRGETMPSSWLEFRRREHRENGEDVGWVKGSGSKQVSLGNVAVSCSWQQEEQGPVEKGAHVRCISGIHLFGLSRLHRDSEISPFSAVNGESVMWMNWGMRQWHEWESKRAEHRCVWLESVAETVEQTQRSQALCFERGSLCCCRCWWHSPVWYLSYFWVINVLLIYKGASRSSNVKYFNNTCYFTCRNVWW